MVEQWSRVAVHLYDYRWTPKGVLWDFNSLTATENYNAPGKFSFVVAADHKMMPTIVDPAANVRIVVDGSLFCSGRITELSGEVDATKGTVTVTGETWMSLLTWTIIYPVPLGGMTGQTTPWWQYAGDAESIVKRLVDEQVRSRLGWPIGVEASSGRGPQVQVSGRFQSVEDRLTDVFLSCGLDFRLQHSAPETATPLRFTCRTPRVWALPVNKFGVVEGGSWKTEPPTTTHTVVGSRGQGVQRKFFSALGASHSRWRREAFVDATDLEPSDTLTAAASDQQAQTKATQSVADGIGSSSLDITLVETRGFQWGDPYKLGDVITMEVGPTLKVTDRITSVTLSVKPDGGEEGGVLFTPTTGGWDKAQSTPVEAAVRRTVAAVKDLRAQK